MGLSPMKYILDPFMLRDFPRVLYEYNAICGKHSLMKQLFTNYLKNIFLVVFDYYFYSGHFRNCAFIEHISLQYSQTCRDKIIQNT